MADWIVAGDVMGKLVVPRLDEPRQPESDSATTTPLADAPSASAPSVMSALKTTTIPASRLGLPHMYEAVRFP